MPRYRRAKPTQNGKTKQTTWTMRRASTFGMRCASSMMLQNNANDAAVCPLGKLDVGGACGSRRSTSGRGRLTIFVTGTKTLASRLIARTGRMASHHLRVSTRMTSATTTDPPIVNHVSLIVETVLEIGLSEAVRHPATSRESVSSAGISSNTFMMILPMATSTPNATRAGRTARFRMETSTSLGVGRADASRPPS